LDFPDNRPSHANTSSYEYQYRETKDGGSKGICPAQTDGPPVFSRCVSECVAAPETSRRQIHRLRQLRRKGLERIWIVLTALPATVYLGLAVTAHNRDAPAIATFQDLSVQK
jgi:hypothetical protein